MLQLFRIIYDPHVGDTFQFLGVHALRWQVEWGMPAVAFVEVDEETQRLADAALAQALEACRWGLVYVETQIDYLERRGAAIAVDTLEIREALRAAIAAASADGDEGDSNDRY